MGNATTSSVTALGAAVRARCAEIAVLCPRAARGDSRAVHRARTATRRLRELLPVVDNLSPDAGARRLRRDARRLTRALGPVRELDVAIDVLADETCGHAASGPEIAAIDRALQKERRDARRTLRRELEKFDLDAWRTRGDALADALVSNDRGRTWGVALSRRVGRRSSRLLGAVDAAGTLYAPETLHDVRIAAKKLRYSIEVARDIAGLAVDEMLNTIKGIQDRLGVIHDLHVLDRRIRAMSWPGGRSGAMERRPALLAALEQECRRQHAAYLSRRDALERSARHAATMVAAALGRRRPVRMKLVRPTRPRTLAS